MRKIRFICAIVIVSFLSFIGCDDEKKLLNEKEYEQTVESNDTIDTDSIIHLSVVLNCDTLSLYVGDTDTLIAKVMNGDSIIGFKVTWSIDSASIAAVDSNGVVTALSIGSAVVTVSCQGVSYICTIIINPSPEPHITKYEYVDLGLSVKWATFNVGAVSVEDYGDYYAWGEIDTKSSLYAWSNYKLGSSPINKYNMDSELGPVDNIVTLDSLDDVAHVKWGDNWRMPTQTEFNELINNCTWTWTSIKGVNGYQITSNVTGYTNNSIFLPAAGYRRETKLNDDGSCGCYWSSTLATLRQINSYYAMNLNIDSIDVNMSFTARFYGQSVRPVMRSAEWLSTINIDIIENDDILFSGRKTKLDVIVKHNDEVIKWPVLWTSDNPSVAVVNNGVVTAISAGTAIIKASIDSISAECAVTVIEESDILHDYVDLGLSVNWATLNVGSLVPEESGGYYSWGELETKDSYYKSSYKWINDTTVLLTKYNTDSSKGKVDDKVSLDFEDDVAFIRWGGDWRMPTKEEIEELTNNCTWTWTKQNGVDGYLVASNVSGYTDRSIFLPATGHIEDALMTYHYSSYWSRSLDYLHNSYVAWSLHFNTKYVVVTDEGRFDGVCVRPVCSNNVVTKVSFSKTEVSLIVNDDIKLEATLLNNGGVAVEGKIQWSSSDESIATVSSEGVITAIKTGTCTVTASVGLAKTTCIITVTDNENGFGYVDLGLSVNWASFNVGAEEPEGHGDLYSWGELEPKDSYTSDNYTFKTTLNPEDDVAHVKWGGNWRMPNKEEQAELLNKCTWTWTTLNGKEGYRVTSNIPGYTDKSIFLPLTTPTHQGEYWSSSFDGLVNCIYFYSSSVEGLRSNGYWGMAVRAVCPSDEWLSSLSVSFPTNDVTLLVENKDTLSVIIKHDEEELGWSALWSSDNPSVAEVDQNGVVTAKTKGIAHITATVRSKSAQCTITVIEESEIEHQYVDLGLSVNWATFNVGAISPEDYGAYYSWGEVDIQDTEYKWYYNGDYKNLTKYNTDDSYGTVDNKITLDPEDDVAHVKWGGNWRMPTDTEVQELLNNCTWTWMTINGVNGCRVTSNKDGYTDRSIFLPATGYKLYSKSVVVGTEGHYWSSSLDWGLPYYSDGFWITTNEQSGFLHIRYEGCSIRPVCPNTVVSSIALSNTEVSLVVENYVQLEATPLNNGGVIVTSSADCEWMSSDESVAIVSKDGLVTAIGSGNCIITVSMGSIKSTCSVVVIDGENGHGYVDLGLSVKWATCNIGAINSEEYGDYYAWGEVESKSIYDWDNYKYANGRDSLDELLFSKYDEYNMYIEIKLNQEDDVAHEQWGGNWRMPTYDELKELMDNCTWTWTKINNVYGYTVTSNKSGYSNRSIFLPSAGRKYDDVFDNYSYDGYYWSSDRSAINNQYAYYLSFMSNMTNTNIYNLFRYIGMSIRPVCP